MHDQLSVVDDAKILFYNKYTQASTYIQFVQNYVQHNLSLEVVSAIFQFDLIVYLSSFPFCLITNNIRNICNPMLWQIYCKILAKTFLTCSHKPPAPPALLFSFFLSFFQSIMRCDKMRFCFDIRHVLKRVMYKRMAHKNKLVSYYH